MHFASDVCLLLGTNKGEVIVYDVRPEVGYKELHRHTGCHNGRVKGIVSAGEGCFASMGGDGSICIWSYKQQEDDGDIVFEGPVSKEDVQLALSIEGPREDDGKGAALARITAVSSNGYNWSPAISFQTKANTPSTPVKKQRKQSDDILCEEMSSSEVKKVLSKSDKLKKKKAGAAAAGKKKMKTKGVFSKQKGK